MDLVKEFLTNNFQLQEGSIYSADDVQQSTINAIGKIKDANKYDLDEGKSLTDKDPDKRAKYMDIHALTTQEHPGIFNQIDELRGMDRLSPGYQLEKRIENYIIKRIDHLHEVPNSFLLELQKEDKKNPLYSGWFFERLRGNPNLEGYDQDKIKYLQSQIEAEIDLEKKTAFLAKSLYEFIDLAISGKSIEDEFEIFFNSVENKDIVGDVYSKEDWRNAINRVVNTIKTKIEDIGIPMLNLKLVGEGPYVDIKGNIRLSAVDINGNVHIFKIKASKNNFANWDSAKTANTDWELAMERQLLGQHINIENSQLYVIPITIGALKNPTKIIVEDFENRTTDKLVNQSKISRIADKLLPRKFHNKYDDSKIEKIKEKFNKIVPTYELKTEKEDETFEGIMEKAEKRFEKEGV